MDQVIRPRNSLLLIAPQAEEGTPAALNPAVHAVPFETDSLTYGSPYTTEESNENTGSYVAGAPLVIGQQVPISFRSRMKGAGAGTVYTAAVKPPLHNLLQICGMRGQFTAAIAAVALAGGSETSATLAADFAATAQAYFGMPLILTGGEGAGHVPLVTGYNVAREATLSDQFAQALSAATSAALPANWTYAGTSPKDAAERTADHPVATVGYYEDGNLHQWQDVRGYVDLDGQTARPGFGAFTLTGTYLGSTPAAVPTGAVIAGHSAPMLIQGTGAAPAALVNRRPVPISRWAMRNGGELESVADPNTPQGFGASQIAGRRGVFEADPLRTLVSTHDALAEIAAADVYPIALRFGSVAGNRWSLLVGRAQPFQANPETRGQLRSDAMAWQALNGGRDAYGRDTDRIVCFF